MVALNTWPLWIDGTVTNTTSSSTWTAWTSNLIETSSTATWASWTNNLNTTSNTNTWFIWVDDQTRIGPPAYDDPVPAPYVITPRISTEEYKRREEETKRREDEYRRQLEETRRKRHESSQRAMELLRAFLDEKQRNDLEKHKAFTVMGKSGTLYRIHDHGVVANVEVLDKRGKRVRRLCAHPQGVPQGDVMLSQKLHLEANEEDFVRIANAS